MRRLRMLCCIQHRLRDAQTPACGSAWSNRLRQAARCRVQALWTPPLSCISFDGGRLPLPASERCTVSTGSQPASAEALPSREQTQRAARAAWPSRLTTPAGGTQPRYARARFDQQARLCLPVVSRRWRSPTAGDRENAQRIPSKSPHECTPSESDTEVYSDRLGAFRAASIKPAPRRRPRQRRVRSHQSRSARWVNIAPGTVKRSLTGNSGAFRASKKVFHPYPDEVPRRTPRPFNRASACRSGCHACWLRPPAPSHDQNARCAAQRSSIANIRREWDAVEEDHMGS